MDLPEMNEPDSSVGYPVSQAPRDKKFIFSVTVRAVFLAIAFLGTVWLMAFLNSQTNTAGHTAILLGLPAQKGH